MPSRVSPEAVTASNSTVGDSAAKAGADASRDEGKFIFDISGIDLSARLADQAEIERYNPHRHEMSFLDAIVWTSPDRSRGIAVRKVRSDEFWVRGHFPEMPMYPGVLQIECGAQMACYLFNSRRQEPVVAAFLRIQDAAFRNKVSPGDTLYILCKDIKFGRRNFTCAVQGVVGDRVAFEATISGMSVSNR